MPRMAFRLPRYAVQTRAFASTSRLKVEDHDIVIVGGGNVGLALAAALLSKEALRDTYKVTLIESSDLTKIATWNPSPESFENRCSSITRKTKSFLKNIGVWEHIRADRTAPMLEMQVWDGLSKARLHLDSFEAPQDDLEDLGMAFMTENTNLQQALLLRLQELAFGRKFELLAPSKVASIERDAADRGSWPILKTDSGREIRARLLVGADGPNSPVRKYANIDTHGWMYDEHGVVATMELETFSDNRTAWQRFLPSGPIAFLPMPDDKATLVWSTRPAVAAAVKKLRPETFAALVNAAFRLPFDSISFLYDRLLDPSTTEEQLLDDISWRSSYDVVGPEGTPSVFSNDLPPEVLAIQPGSVASFPFRYAHANSYMGEPPLGETLPSRTVLVGDAAHSMHPLAGQGLNTGLGDAESLANALESALHVGEDPGSVLALRGYTRDRYFANHLLMSGVDKLHKLYGTEAGLVVWARSMGLEVVNESSTLRSFFMNQAGSSAQLARRSSPLMSGLAHAVQLGTAATQLLTQTAGAVANHWLAPRQGR